MAAENLDTLLTGGAINSNPLLSLGGDRSFVRLRAQQIESLESSLFGMTVEHATGLDMVYSGIRIRDGALMDLESPAGEFGASVNYTTSGRYNLQRADENGALVVYLDMAEFSALPGSYPVTVGAFESNLFPPQQLADAEAGTKRYRCLWVQNSGDYIDTLTAYVRQQPFGCTIGLGVDPVGSGTGEGGAAPQTIPDEFTAPVDVDFSYSTDPDAGLSLPAIFTGEGVSLWIELGFNESISAWPDLSALIAIKVL